MVDSIKSGQKLLIITKPKPKTTEKAKDGSFDKVVSDKAETEGSRPAASPMRSAEVNPALADKQGMLRMQRLDEIARQIKDGSYKLVDPEVLAERIMKAAFDPQTRAKFVKKALAEEIENAKSKNRLLTELDLKKLIQLVKGGSGEEFDDPELEAWLKEFA